MRIGNKLRTIALALLASAVMACNATAPPETGSTPAPKATQTAENTESSPDAETEAGTGQKLAQEWTLVNFGAPW